MQIITRAKSSSGKAEYPLYIVFAYETDAPTLDEFDRITTTYPDATSFISGISVLTKGNWIAGNDQSPLLSKNKTQNAIEFVVSLSDVLHRISAQRGELNLRQWLQLAI